MIDPKVLAELILEVESEDPIDWGMLAIDEAGAAELIAASVAEMYEKEIDSLSGAARDYALASTIGKLVLENFVLNAKLRLRDRGV